MSPDERINELSARVNRHEDETRAEFQRLYAKLDGDLAVIRTKLEALTVTVSKESCPEPGLCLILRTEILMERKRMDNHEKEVSRRLDILDKQFAADQARFVSLEKWQAWIMGGAALLMVIFGLFGPAIRAVLKLP